MYIRPTKILWADQPKIQAYAPIKNFNLMADHAKRLIFQKIHAAAQKSLSLGHFCANQPNFFANESYEQYQDVL